LLGQIGLEKIMTRLARIGLAAAFLLGGATFAMAQNGPLTGGYPPATKNPNLYGYYYHHPYYHHRYYGYHHPYYHHRYYGYHRY
jgi:hypothetical protein